MDLQKAKSNRYAKKYEMNYDEMKRWYDGYLYQDQYMYNPNSVVKAIAFRNIIGY